MVFGFPFVSLFHQFSLGLPWCPTLKPLRKATLKWTHQHTRADFDLGAHHFWRAASYS